MRLAHWALTGTVLATMCVPLTLRAEGPATRPAAEQRRGGPDGPGPGGRRMGPPPGQLIEDLRKLAKDLNLSDEQKTKIESVLTKAADDFKEIRNDLEAMDPRDRRERIEEILGTMRKGINDALGDEQRQTLRKKMNELRPGGGQRPGGEGSPQTPRPGPLVEQLQQNAEKLGLSAEQKKRIEAVVADVKAQLEEVRPGLASGDEQAREKLGEVMMDLRRQVGEILTPEQRELLRGMMAPPNPDGPPMADGARRPRRGPGDEMKGEEMGPDARRPRRGPGEEMKGEDMIGPDGARRPRRGPGDEMMGEDMMGPDGARRPRRDDRRVDRLQQRGPTTSPSPGSAGKIGTPAPPFELTKLDGRPVRLSNLQGRVGVIVFGSYSSPSFRQRAPEIESLAKKFGSRASFLIVYTKEAHPAGDWDVERNKDSGIAVQAHKDATARAAAAEKAEHALKLTIPIAMDTMDDAVAAAYGGFPNGAVVLSRDGTILARQQWVDPDGLETRIEHALKTPTSKPAQ